MDESMIGIVTKSTGSWYDVREINGHTIKCRMKGKIRLQGLKHTNPITVGDKVHYELEPDQETGVIHSIDPRVNYIIRKASNLSKQTHIIASNIDQAIVIASFKSPETSTGFIDRFLVTAEAYHIPAIIVFNKSDLIEPSMQTHVDDIVKMYEQIGYPVMLTSVQSGIGLAQLADLMHDKTTLFTGHSGVGKSSLLNAIDANLQIKTGVVSAHHQKGQHTTTFAEMHALQQGGFIIDTPGIREFGVVDVTDAELSHYFKEMKNIIGQCRFNNCQHTNEPGCAVKEALNKGIIDPRRYHSYLSILANEDLYA